MNKLENLKDEELVLLSRKGNESAFEIIMKRHLSSVYGFSRRYTGNPDKAADIAQETFIKVWRNLNKFDSAKLFRPWLYAIAKNTALDWLKKREGSPFSSFATEEDKSPLFDIADPLPPPSAIVDRKIAIEKIEAVASKLPERYYSVITMREKHDLTFREIAKRLRKPLNTVKSHYRRALRLLKIRVKEAGDTE
jgi:RNA polymerase sigma-70 factor (ECF subfamily)